MNMPISSIGYATLQSFFFAHISMLDLNGLKAMRQIASQLSESHGAATAAKS